MNIKKIFVWTGIMLILVLNCVIAAQALVYRDGESVIYSNSWGNLTVNPENVTGHFPVEQEVTICNKESFPVYVWAGFAFEKGQILTKNAYIYKNLTIPKTQYNYGDVQHSYTCNYDFNYTLDYKGNGTKYFWCYTTNLSAPPENQTYVVKEHSFLSGNIDTKTAYWTERGIIGTETINTYRMGYSNINNAFDKANKFNKDIFYNDQGKRLQENSCVKIKLSYTPKNNTGKWDAYFFADTVNDFGCILNDDCLHSASIDPTWTASNWSYIATPNVSFSTAPSDSSQILWLKKFTQNESDAISCWHLDESSGSNATDSCGSNDGAITGSIGQEYSLMDLNYSRTFSNAGTTEFTSNGTGLCFTNENFTVTFWAKITGGGAEGAQGVVGRGAWKVDGWQISIDKNHAAGSTLLLSTAGYRKFIQGPGPIPSDEWMHFAFVRDDSAANGGKIYYNGVEQTITAGVGALVDPVCNSARTLQIGDDADGLGSSVERLTGNLDELQIWDRALSAEEISALHQDNLCTRLMNASSDCSDIEVYDDNSDTTVPFVPIVNATGASWLGNQSGIKDELLWDAIYIPNPYWNQTTNFTSNIKVSTNGVSTTSTNDDANEDLLAHIIFEPALNNGQLKDISGKGFSIINAGTANYLQSNACYKGSGQTSLGCYDLTNVANSYLYVPNGESDLTTVDYITVSFWFDGDACVNDGILQSSYNPSTHDFIWSAYCASWLGNTINFPIKGTVGSDVCAVPTSSTMALFTMTYNGTHHICYKNGVAVDTNVVSIGPLKNLSGTYDLTIGAYYSSSYLADGRIDDIKIFNRSLSADEVLGEYNKGAQENNIPMWSAITSNFGPTISSASWATTGGFTSGTRTFGQSIDNITGTCADSDSESFGCNITITEPSGTIAVDNVAMTNISGNDTSFTARYDTDLTLDQVGNWTIVITAWDSDGATATNTQKILVANTVQSSIDGYYGFTSNGIIAESDIGTYAETYKFDLLELEDNITTMDTDWTTIKARLNTSYNTNLVAGLNIIMDCNCSDQTNVSSYITDITNDFDDLLTGNYRTTLQYISLEFLNDSYTTAEADDCYNNISAEIVSVTNNQFPVYNRGYTSSGLDSSYLQDTIMQYNEKTTQSSFINWEAAISRNTSYLNRIYSITLQNSTLLVMSKDLQDKAYKILRSTINESTTIVNTTVAELDNYDILVFNNESTAWNDKSITVNSGIGKDIYDDTNEQIVEMNNDLTFFVDVGAYSVSYLQFDDFDHYQLDSLSSGTLYKATTTGAQNFTWHDGAAHDGANQVTGSTRRLFYLYDSKFVPAGVQVYYGWLNASQERNFSDRNILIIADKNDAEVDAIIGQATYTMGYIGVFDYNQSNTSWLAEKEAEVDDWYNINSSMGIFFDGLDTATIINATDFENKFKNLTDFAKIEKNMPLALNTYTYSEEYSTWGDFIMKESCINRWNGDNASAPTSYARENWDLELNKSTFFHNHNLEVICQAFGNNTGSTPRQPYNMTDVLNIFYGAAVLGYSVDNFGYNQPNFLYTQDVYLPDLGTDLSNTYSTDDNETYYRTYSNGVVYYNTTSEQGWFDDGREFESVKLYAYIHDEATPETYDFLISDGLGTQYNYSVSSAGDGWSYEYVEFDLNTSTQYSNGRYRVEVAGETGTAYLGYDNSGLTHQGLRSWYSTDSGVTWTAETANTMYLMNLEVNDSRKASLDTFDGVTQTETTTNGDTNITLNGAASFNLPVWSVAKTLTLNNFNNASYWDGSVYTVLNIANTSDCNTDNPTWSTTSIAGETHKACRLSEGNTHIVRFVAPDMDVTRTYNIDGNTAPTLNNIQLLPNTAYTDDSLNCSADYSDTDLDSGTVWIRWYLNTTLNETSSVSVNNGDFVNFTLNNSYYSKGWNVTCELWAGDGVENSTKVNTTKTISNSIPNGTISITSPVVDQIIDVGASNTYDITWTGVTDNDDDTISYIIEYNYSNGGGDTKARGILATVVDDLVYEWNLSLLPTVDVVLWITPTDGTDNGTTTMLDSFVVQSLRGGGVGGGGGGVTTYSPTLAAMANDSGLNVSMALDDPCNVGIVVSEINLDEKEYLYSIVPEDAEVSMELFSDLGNLRDDKLGEKFVLRYPLILDTDPMVKLNAAGCNQTIIKTLNVRKSDYMFSVLVMSGVCLLIFAIGGFVFQGRVKRRRRQQR